MANAAKRKFILMIAAGGTGGHVFPALAIAKHIVHQSVDIVWLGTKRGLETSVIPKVGFKLETLNVEGLRSRRLGAWLLSPWLLSVALLRTAYLILKYRPDAVLGMGGFVAGPVCLMGAIFNIPIIIHEQNAIAGVTNRILTRLSKRVLLGFPGSIHSAKAEYVSNPVRSEIADLPAPDERFSAREGAIRLLVIGGSQGAAIFNETVAAALALMLPTRRPEVKQQTGKGKYEDARKYARENGIKIDFFEFCDDMASMFAWADLVLCRAGASSIAELAAVGVASILVPYPFSMDDHQTANANYLVQDDAAKVIAQQDFTPKKLADTLNDLCGDRGKLQLMAANARKLGRKDSAERIAEICIEEMAA